MRRDTPGTFPVTLSSAARTVVSLCRKRSCRICVIDEYPMARDWLAELIGRDGDLAYTGGASNLAAGLRLIAKAEPDLAIVDTARAEETCDLIRNLKKEFRGLAVLVFSGAEETVYGEVAMRAGARGYVSKRETSDRLLNKKLGKTQANFEAKNVAGEQSFANGHLDITP